jgi:hypothetical protein
VPGDRDLFVGEKPDTMRPRTTTAIAGKVLSTCLNGTIRVEIQGAGQVWVTGHDVKNLAALPPRSA